MYAENTRRSFVRNSMCMIALLSLSLSHRFAYAEPKVRGEEETAALEAAQKQYDEAKQKLQAVGSKLESTQVEKSRTEADLRNIQGDIEVTQGQIEETAKELVIAQDALAAFCEISYKSGSLRLFDVLMSSRDLNDYVTRGYYAAAVQDSQIETINDIKELKQRLEDQKILLSNQEEEQAKLLQKLEEQEAELAAQKAEADAIVAGLSEEVQLLFEAQQAELLEAAQIRATATAAAQAGAEIGIYFPGESQGSIVEDAYACLGIPYVWGGDDTNFGAFGGFDCSGFVQHCYALEGYEIGRSTWDQIAQIQALGNWVEDIELMEPGDLIFPYDGHVGIYIGKNQFIDAPYPGMFVQIDDVTEYIGGGSPV